MTGLLKIGSLIALFYTHFSNLVGGELIPALDTSAQNFNGDAPDARLSKRARLEELVKTQDFVFFDSSFPLPACERLFQYLGAKDSIRSWSRVNKASHQLVPPPSPNKN